MSAFPDVLCLSRAEADLSDPEGCAEAIRAQAPRAVINAAAYTAVDKAEEEEDLAATINGEAPGAMARAIVRHTPGKLMSGAVRMCDMCSQSLAVVGRPTPRH